MQRSWLGIWIALSAVAMVPDVWTASGEALTSYSDRASFEADTGAIVEIDFEAIPHDATSCTRDPGSAPLDNPLVIDGVTITDPYCLSAGFCSSPTCTTDADNPFGSGNIVLFLNPGTTIQFPAGTRGALLVVEGIGSGTGYLQVVTTDGAAADLTVQGVLYGTAYGGWVYNGGIDQITIARTSGGPLVLTELLVDLGGDAGPGPPIDPPGCGHRPGHARGDPPPCR